MKRSVYSLVLLDGVIDQIDRLANSVNMSRSNLVNQILAEYVNLLTPEKRIRDIFEYLENCDFDDTIRLLPKSGDAVMFLESVLSYKYRPAVHYSLKLYRSMKPEVGCLKVSSRTKSDELISKLEEFYTIWLESESYFGKIAEAKLGEGKFIREFRQQNKKLSAERIARDISLYINAFDNALKSYFEGCDSDYIIKCCKRYAEDSELI